MNCLNCGLDSLELWSTVRDEEYGTMPDQKFDYYRCPSCETLSIGETLEDRLGEIYPKTYYSFESKNYNLLYKIKFAMDSLFYKKISRKFKFPDALKVLDIGGGTGEVLRVFERALSQKRISGTVIDLDNKVHGAVSEKGYEYICGSFLTHDFKDKKFDVLIALNILEHVEDPNLFLRQCSSLLRPGGVILIQTPNWQSLDARLFRRSYWGGLHAPRHFVIFSKKSLSGSLESAGFELAFRSDAPAGPFWTWSVLGSLSGKGRSLKPLHKSPFFPVLAAVFTLFDFFTRGIRSTSQQLVVAKKK